MARNRLAISSRSQMRGDLPNGCLLQALVASAMLHACHLPNNCDSVARRESKQKQKSKQQCWSHFKLFD
jgi:hypothetical protein